MIIKFHCDTCRQKELERVEAMDKVTNKGKRFFGKQQTPLDEKNFLTEASEVIIVSHANPRADETEQPNALEGIKSKCSVCGQTTFNYIKVQGLTDL